MASRSEDPKVDGLYQLPPNDFTRERNALAKEIGGDEGKRIKALPKPSASAWAVNQLYWRDRPTYDALVSASEHLRTAHRAVLAGRSADLRAADAAHRQAANAAMASTLRLAKEAGQNVSSAMQTEIARTLESLPAEGPAGHLAKPLSPGGFEALQGMPIRAPKLRLVPKPEEPPKPAKPSRGDRHTSDREREQAQRERQDADRQRQEAQRALKEARERERRERENVARLEKQIARAERETAAAKTALDGAQKNESRLRADLRDAQEIFERAAKQRRQIEEASS